MDGMMKTKKASKIVCLAVAMMFLFTSIASAAVPAGLYLGGSLNQYISMDYFWANDGENQTEIADLMTQAGLPNVIYVDENENYANMADLAAGMPLDEALQPLTPDNLDDVLPADGYTDVENPENVIVPSLPVAENTAVADVDFGALGFTDIKVTSTTVNGVAKFQVAGSTTIADLNTAIRILKGADQTEVLITLLASDGTTVLGTGTLTFPANDATGIVFDVTATPVQTSGTAIADVDFGALGFTDIKVTSTDFVGAAKFQVAGSTTVADLNNAIRILKGADQATVEITLLDSDGAALAAGTLTFPAADATGISFEVNAL